MEYYLDSSIPGLGGHHNDTVMGLCIHHEEGKAGHLVVHGVHALLHGQETTFTVYCMASPLIVPSVTGMLDKSKECMLTPWNILLWATLLFPPLLQSPLGFAAFCQFLPKTRTCLLPWTFKGRK